MALAALMLLACAAGQASFQNGDFAAAQEQLWNCVAGGTQDRSVGFHLASTYRELRNYDSGLNKAAAILKNSPDNGDALYVAAFLNFRRGDTTRSMLLLSRADHLDHNDWRLHQLFALNYSVFNMLGSAELEFQRAIALNSGHAELHYQLARLYFTQGRYAESIQASNAALAVFPDYPEVYENLGLAYEGSGDPARASASFQRAVDLNEKLHRRDEWPLIDYAMFHLQQGTPEASVPLLARALTFNSSSFKANYEMGRATRSLNRDDEAQRYLEKALQLEPNDPSACFALASVMKRKGNDRRAKELLARYQVLRQQSNAR